MKYLNYLFLILMSVTVFSGCGEDGDPPPQPGGCPTTLTNGKPLTISVKVPKDFEGTLRIDEEECKRSNDETITCAPQVLASGTHLFEITGPDVLLSVEADIETVVDEQGCSYLDSKTIEVELEKDNACNEVDSTCAPVVTVEITTDEDYTGAVEADLDDEIALSCTPAKDGKAICQTVGEVSPGSYDLNVRIDEITTTIPVPLTRDIILPKQDKDTEKTIAITVEEKTNLAGCQTCGVKSQTVKVNFETSENSCEHQICGSCGPSVVVNIDLDPSLEGAISGSLPGDVGMSCQRVSEEQARCFGFATGTETQELSIYLEQDGGTRVQTLEFTLQESDQTSCCACQWETTILETEFNKAELTID